MENFLIIIFVIFVLIVIIKLFSGDSHEEKRERYWRELKVMLGGAELDSEVMNEIEKQTLMYGEYSAKFVIGKLLKKQQEVKDAHKAHYESLLLDQESNWEKRFEETFKRLKINPYQSLRGKDLIDRLHRDFDSWREQD